MNPKLRCKQCGAPFEHGESASSFVMVLGAPGELDRVFCTTSCAKLYAAADRSTSAKKDEP